ncbi:glutamate receptor 2.8-like [Wolffia australiana]
MMGDVSAIGLSSTSLVIFLLLYTSFATHLPQPAFDEKTSSFKVGVILNLGTKFGNSSRLCMEIALSDFYLAHSNHKTRLDLVFMNSPNDPLSAASAAENLITKQEVQAIVGPQTSEEAAFVSLLGNANKVPVISFSATSPSISHEKTPFFIRTAMSDSFQASAIAALVSHFTWKQIVPIYEQSEYGAGMISYVVNALKAIGAWVPYRTAIPPVSSDDFISKELLKLMNMECRVFLVNMRKSLALRLFAKAREAGMMDKDFVWILSDGLTSQLGTIRPPILRRDFYGVLGLKTLVKTSRKLQDFENRWLKVSRNDNLEVDRSDLTVFGLWAYDTVWALAVAAETEFQTNPRSENNLKTGWLKTILDVEFNGISGEFQLSGGERKRPVFEIVNVAGSSERTVGYWTEKGLQRYHSGEGSNFSTEGLSPVIWPGDTTVIPRGWVNPTVGKKLRILVPGPVKTGFHPFLRAEKDPKTGKLAVDGFVIDVFETALKELPYAVPIEYVQHNITGSMKKPTYDELVQFVFQQKYDGLVGDVTITANRSNYVDFTLPYLPSGIRMIVPLRDDWSGSAWRFLEPLSWKLWIVTGGFVIFTGFVVWVLEHRFNDAFRNSIKDQVGTTSYFIFSTLVYHHKEAIKSNLGRLVVIVWILVVLVLQSSYTASLTSMLTIRHLKPITFELRELGTQDSIGYLRGSFTGKRLLKEGFDPNRLKPFSSPEEYLDALGKGSKSGGVSAIFDEIPYIRLFLKNYCKNYTMAGTAYKAGGFGFVFPKGSPLVPDLSLALLRLGEGDRILEIEKRWFGDLSSCGNNESTLTSDRLNMAMFWVLFLITGLSSTFAVIGSLICFLHGKRRQLLERNPGERLMQKVVSVANTFDEKSVKSTGVRQRKITEMSSSRDLFDSSFIGRSENGPWIPSPSYCPSTSTDFSPPEERSLPNEQKTRAEEGTSNQ